MNLNCGRKERSRRGPPHIVRGVLSAGKTLIVDVEGADCRVEGIGASGPAAHQLFRTSDLRYLA